MWNEMNTVRYIDENTEAIKILCKRDKRLAKVISMVGSISYEIPSDGYAFLVHEVIEQMLSIKTAAKIFQRFEILCGGTVTPNVVSGLSDSEIKSIGTAKTKVRYIREITNAVLGSALDLEELSTLEPEAAFQKLTSIKGIGNWTAKMYLLFVLESPDILPYEDVAFLQSYRWMYKTDDVSKQSIIRRCSKWKPYSSYASRYLYRALDMGLTKQEFHLFK